MAPDNSRNLIRFVVIAQARTGSTLLISSLARHPDIQCRGEILNAGHCINDLPHDGRQRLLAAWEPLKQCRAVGFKLLAHQPWTNDRDSWVTAWDELADTPDAKVIVLRRTDRTAQYASWKVANAMGSWQNQRQFDRPVVDISDDELRWFKHWNDQLLAERLRRLARHDILDVEYETLCSDWPAEIERIQRFIGVDVHPLEQARRKDENRPLTEVIANHSELSPCCSISRADA